jgi:hypothetical protein
MEFSFDKQIVDDNPSDFEARYRVDWEKKGGKKERG